MGSAATDHNLPDPIRRDPEAERKRLLSGPSVNQRQPIQPDSPPPPPTPEKDTPPRKKKHQRKNSNLKETTNVRDTKSSPVKPHKSAHKHTNSSPIKPSSRIIQQQLSKGQKQKCDSLHLYCKCPRSASAIAPIVHKKLFFGDDNDPDDPIKALELSGDLPSGHLDLQNRKGLAIFGVDSGAPTSVLHGDGDLLLTRQDKATRVLSDPRLRDIVLAREQKLLYESEKRKRAEYERSCALEAEGRRWLAAKQQEERRQAEQAAREKAEREKREKREAEEAEQFRRQQIEKEYPALLAEVEELRQLKKEFVKVQRSKDAGAQLQTQQQLQTLQQEILFLREFKYKIKQVQPEIVRMVFEGGTAYPESDADDEYERSLHDTSPILATDDEETESEGSGGQTSNEHTPTTYGRMGRDRDGDNFPEGLITEWNAEDCADFLASLGYGQYADAFLGTSHTPQGCSGFRNQAQLTST